MKIAKDTVVSLRYELSDANGALLEKTDDPISYLHGGYDGIFPTVEEALGKKLTIQSAICTAAMTVFSPTVEEALHGNDVGFKFNVTMEPDSAFGDYDHDLVRTEPRNLFPESIEIGIAV
ncbi:MAG: hypothetical protein WDM70_04490 [Nitrosomonadales bacterium]